MRKNLKRLWFPSVIVLLATIQTFGMDIIRTGGAVVPETVADTVIYDNSRVFTKFRGKADKASGDAVIEDFTLEEGDLLTARDTIHAPDSLKDIDPFRYKYYVALVDSLTHVQIRDSLRAAGDSLDWPRLDSLYFADSAATAKRKFEEWYNSLDKNARKRYDYEQKMKVKMRQTDSILAIKDSLQAIRDSIRESTPRILETFAIPDSMFYKRIVAWNKSPLYNTPSLTPIDTGYNYRFNDYPFMRNDVNVSYLGISGSPVKTYDFFRQEAGEDVSFYAPYESYSFSPYTLPMYNTKTPYTELAYYGTLFANIEREETDIHILTTQNIYPSLNVTFLYDRYGANGMLDNESTDNRTVVFAGNYLGKKYMAHGGFIFNQIKRKENGGIVDNFWIRDTLVGSRDIDVRLRNADNRLFKRTWFLDQTYRIPFSFIGDIRDRIAGKKAAADSLATENAAEEAVQKNEDVTTAFIGHSSEYSQYTKIYHDNISASDENAREFYGNRFYIHPTTSHDSIKVSRFDNRIFLRLQPWSEDAIVSTVNVGIGDKLMSYYMFSPDGYLSPAKNHVENTLYLYGGAAGRFRKYIDWKADGYYNFAGDNMYDFGIDAGMNFNFYPFRRHRNSPVSIGAAFSTTLKSPDYLETHYFSNHLRWDNDFDRISTTKLEGSLDIPLWDLSVNAGYSLLAGNIYYDNMAIARQNTTAMSVFKAGLRKDISFKGIHLDNSLLFQMSSDESVLPLPRLAANLKWYFQFDVVKNVMQMQIGANALYTTKWNAPSYSPQSGLFHNQDKNRYGGCPYIDVFLNVQWKRATIFVKMINANMGWPNDSADYFSADGYIRPQRGVKFGIWWPFYIQPNRNNAVSASGGSRGGSGSGSSSSGISGGRTGVSSGNRGIQQASKTRR